MTYHGRVALVTGGGSGMGQRMCERMAAQGAKVAALDVNEEGLAKTAATSDNIATYTCDVTDTEGVLATVKQVEADLGPVDRVAAAAAIMPSDAILEQETSLILKMMDINYGGVVNIVKATLPQMVERHQGDMIIFSSLMGHMSIPYLGAYCASKHAVKSFADILYHENRASGVRFACVCPPAVKTPLIGQLKSNVKSYNERPAKLTPDDVIDAIEDHLDKGKFWVMPAEAKGAAVAARLIPNLIWKNLHKIEQLP